MKILSQTKRLLNKALHPLHLEIQKIKPKATWTDRFPFLLQQGILPKKILDGGANHGLWSLETSKLLPSNTQFLLVEPNPQLQPSLLENTKSLQKILVSKALWFQPQIQTQLHLWNNDPLQTSASLLEKTSETTTQTIPIETTTIDSLNQEFDFQPDLIKLDLQGTELQALQGASQSLLSTQLLLIEFGCLPIYQKRTQPKDLLNLLEPYGFRLYDILNLSYLPSQELCGGDFLFLKQKI